MKKMILLLSMVIQVGTVAAPARKLEPETVMVKFHAKPGSEAELERVIAQHWSTARRLKMVEERPHMTLRGTEEDTKTYFVEVFSWRDASMPDAAPTEIQKIWTSMNGLVEGRGGEPGLRFEVVKQIGDSRR